MLRALVLVAVICALPGSAAADDLRVLVWPARPDTDVTAAQAEVTAAKHQLVSFEPIRARLAKFGTEAQSSETASLMAVSETLEIVRTAYTEQRFDDMVDALEGLESGALAVLALPRNKSTLWEVQFQRGLAELSRSKATAAARRFELALALDEARSPRKELYGPDVARAFAEAADARTARAARAVKLKVTPADARVIIDGVLVVDPARPRSMRPGLHAVTARAPGYETTAAVIEVGAGGDLELELSRATGDAVERIGAAWARGDLDPSSASGLAAIAAVVGEAGATAALVVDATADGGGQARLVAAIDSTPAIRRNSLARAAKAALARLLPSGEIGTGDPQIVGPPPKKKDESSLLSKWWFWTAVGAGATIATVVGFVVLKPDDRIRIVPP